MPYGDFCVLYTSKILVCQSGLDATIALWLPLFLIATLTGLSTLLFILEYLKSGRVYDHLYSSKSRPTRMGF